MKKETVTIPKEEYEHLKRVKAAYLNELENKILYDKQQLALQEQQSHLTSVIPPLNTNIFFNFGL